MRREILVFFYNKFFIMMTAFLFFGNILFRVTRQLYPEVIIFPFIMLSQMKSFTS